uniref:Phospholipase B-like n=1 Tax=Toxocara canis TaxID=6265 RepID=A0A183VGQ5_TOXCA
LQAYYIGVKDNSEVVYLPATSPPVVLTSPGPQVPCLGSCEFHLVESIPANLTYNPQPTFMSTTDAWKKLIANATTQIRIASYYWSLLPESSGGYFDDTSRDVSEFILFQIGSLQ